MRVQSNSGYTQTHKRGDCDHRLTFGILPPILFTPVAIQQSSSSMKERAQWNKMTNLHFLHINYLLSSCSVIDIYECQQITNYERTHIDWQHTVMHRNIVLSIIMINKTIYIIITTTAQHTHTTHHNITV